MTEEITTKELGWFIVEMMGHVRIAGKVSTDNRFGGPLSRVDIPGPVDAAGNESWVSQWFSTQAVYRITSCSEHTARQVAAMGTPSPLHHYEIPVRIEPPRPDRSPQNEGGDDDDVIDLDDLPL